ncbi:MAG TPA: GGDEF domain-containing protein [Ilumatobacter sp.]|nr:GGDEF domain-containing protein [Ilumatobacter sp.]
MSLLRKLALFFSLVLVVSLTVGYFFRRAQLGHERDVSLTSSAERAAERVESLIDAIAVATEAGSDPAATLESIVGRAPHLGVCVVAANSTGGQVGDGVARCGGTGARPSTTEQSDRIERRLAGLIATRAAVGVNGGVVSIDADGAQVSVLVRADPVALFEAVVTDGVRVWVTDSLPEGARLGQFVVADGVRQSAVGLSDIAGVYVVAATADGVSIPSSEANLFLILGVLAAILLMLAGFTAFFEQRSLVERASTDQLTRLPNRSEFERRVGDLIAQSERTGRGFALLLFDLNGFKSINDSYGHQAGDEVLQAVAERLARGTRSGDLVARWGGDEFVVAMPGVVDADMGQRRGTEIAALIGGRTRIDSARESVRVGASVGVAFWPRHGDRLAALLESADAAMYHAKRTGAGCVVAGTTHVPDHVPTEWV